MKRNVYLAMTSLPEARDRFFERFDGQQRLGSERIPVADAVGRVLAESVTATLSAPSYHGAAMDGIAVRARETFGAAEHRPLDLVVGEQAFFVNTGEVLPGDTDAVVMIERVQVLESGDVRIEAPAWPWQHVRRVGEDIVATEPLFTRYHRVAPTDVGALMAGGRFTVPVLRRPSVVVMPTGAELVDPEDLEGAEPPPGRIVEFNGTMLGKLVESVGGTYVRHARVPDDLEQLRAAVREAVEHHDLVMIIGGSSAGAKDFTRAALAGIGEVLAHGVTVMPGKPTLLADVEDTPVVGVPGYPVSAIVCFDQFVGPLLAHMQHQPEPRRPVVTARPTRKVASRLGMEEFVRVRLGRVGDCLVAAPLPRGAGTVSSFTQADGLLRIASNLEGVHADQDVSVELLRPLSVVEENLVCVGSHDLCLDVLADLLRARGSGVTLSSSHVGSLGGLRALRSGACHLAGSHLLDPADGTYNSGVVRRVLGEAPVRLVHLVQRQQGLLVPRDNPKAIRGLADLSRPDLQFVNRQGGSGTRVLLDYELGRLGIEPADVRGYAVEEYTHMAVAVAVLSGAADVGLGIRAAARALDLDFVPVATEDYELVIPEAFFEHPGVQRLLEVVASDAFRDRVAALGGYGTSRTGEVRPGAPSQ